MKTNRKARVLPLGFLLGATLSPSVVGCFPEIPDVEGSCQQEPQSVIDCRVEGYEAGVPVSAGLIGYSCTGDARPDLDGKYDEGFPEGTVCAEKGAVGDGSREGYCCTSAPVDCAYEPVSDCLSPSYSYSCRGTNRPESLNPAIYCGNGIRHGQLTEYCCAGELLPDLCEQSDVAGCQDGLLGFLCRDGSHPRGEQLGANKSRPDHYHFTCTTPVQAPNPDYQTTCCLAPPLVLDGGSCVNHTAVPGCDAGRFGFACYGPDTPEDDFLAMDCPEPGFEGISNEGFQATLYCCDFKE